MSGGLSCRELADEAGVTEATFRGIIWQALKKFTTCLGIKLPDTKDKT